MANLVATLLSFPPDHYTVAPPSKVIYDRDVREYVKQLDKISASSFVKAVDGQELIDLLDPIRNSIAYLYTIVSELQSIASSKPKPLPDDLWTRLSIFCTSFDPIQIRYVGNEFRRLLEHLERLARVYNSPRVPVQLMCAGMLRMDPSGATFTSTHLLYVQLCLEARTLEEALPILDKPIVGFPSQAIKGIEEQPLCADHQVSSAYITLNSGLSSAVSAEDVQEYYLLGAITYIGLRQWRKALTFLEHVLVAPTQNTATGLMLEAYRKWLLVALLIEGKSPSFPRGVNQEALRKIKPTSKAYEAFADIYKSGNLLRLQAEADAGQGLWQDDGNIGLVRQVIRHFTESQVINLSKTYVALPMLDIAQHLGETPAVTAQYLGFLATSGQLNASLERNSATSDTSSQILRFYSDRSSGPLAQSEQQLHAALVEQKQRILELAHQLKDGNRRLSLNKDYLEYAKTRRDRKEQARDGGAMDLDWAGPGEDEDMMGDLR
ncbi:hypothetical protein EV356DRAFT_577917 [Viridothelium virens]|uniref:COP9 signalosome complex subunit 3 n=1 Tax=Viridothelium virens TaxID=1048519 RepID=A0A6A6H4V3_VIRVR|nr:hypothetical protein EV356DRAFT_577917 [Viridothelium virens]